jgi:hypothetical protein
MVVDDKEKLERQLDHNAGNKTSALETIGRLDVDRERTPGPGPREKFDPGPIDLKDLPPLPGDPPAPADGNGKPPLPKVDDLKSPPDLKPDRGDVLPPLPERSLGLDL